MLARLVALILVMLVAGYAYLRFVHKGPIMGLFPNHHSSLPVNGGGGGPNGKNKKGGGGNGNDVLDLGQLDKIEEGSEKAWSETTGSGSGSA